MSKCPHGHLNSASCFQCYPLTEAEAETLKPAAPVSEQIRGIQRRHDFIEQINGVVDEVPYRLESSQERCPHDVLNAQECFECTPERQSEFCKCPEEYCPLHGFKTVREAIVELNKMIVRPSECLSETKRECPKCNGNPNLCACATDCPWGEKPSESADEARDKLAWEACPQARDDSDEGFVKFQAGWDAALEWAKGNK